MLPECPWGCRRRHRRRWAAPAHTSVPEHAPSSPPAGALAASDPTASAACIANPSAPIDDPPAFPSAYLGGCKQCSADGSACVECWKWFGLAANGMCVECPRNGPEGSEYICLDCDGDEPSVCKECIENTETPIVPGLFADEEGRCTKVRASACGLHFGSACGAGPWGLLPCLPSIATSAEPFTCPPALLASASAVRRGLRELPEREWHVRSLRRRPGPDRRRVQALQQ